MGKSSNFGMLLSTVTLVMSLAPVNAKPEFHHNLNEEELRHYFGTPLSHKVPDYEIVSPSPVHGHKTDKDRYRRHDVLEYNLAALGEEYHLKLRHNPSLIPKSCLTHEYKADGTKVVTPCALASDNCYYDGTSLPHNGSRVALSTCAGLHGIIATADHELHIQPIRREHTTRVRRDIADPHIVYKRTTTNTKCHHNGEPFGEVLQRKRRNAGDKTIELLVVADKEMQKFHGDDTKGYALTIMNIAAQRYLQLDEPIHLAVVKIIILTDDKPDLEISKDSKHTLDSFCNWQETFNPKDDSDPQHADASILLTRLDIEIEGNDDDMGLSTFRGMCIPKQRCSINQDTGLDLGLTVAHELGHTLGLTHDGEGNSCEKRKNIMSPNGGIGSQAFQWSNCSIHEINAFKRSKQSVCLDDNPKVQLMNIPDDKPGLIYDANEQCRLSIGEGSTICEGTSIVKDGNECAVLVCYDPASVGFCAAGTAPRMDGTPCGPSKWCIGGKCETYESEDGPRPVAGGWSVWDAEWTACSRTCCGGVKVQRRRCDNPRPMFGGKCDGSNIRAELCNMNSYHDDATWNHPAMLSSCCLLEATGTRHPPTAHAYMMCRRYDGNSAENDCFNSKCKTSGYKFKEEQCAATNSEPTGGRTYSWVPYERQTSVTQCLMQCKALGERMVAMRRPQYQDGTECKMEGAGAFYRCINAKCREFGCDGILDSGTTFDKCGKCEGKGDTCKKLSGIFKKGQKETFVTFVTIPKDSTGITIINKNLRTLMSVKVQGILLFNLGGKRNLSKTYNGKGIHVNYRRVGPERIKISGPLPFDIEAQVWRQFDDSEYRGVAPDIYFEYHVPNVNDAASKFVWKTVAGRCNRACGGGSTARVITCVSADDGASVNRRFCNIQKIPNEQRQPCSTQACPPRWKTGRFGSCSRSCGGGHMNRTIHCVQLNNNKEEVLSSTKCSHLHKSMTSSDCNTKACAPDAAPQSDPEDDCIDKQDCTVYGADVCSTQYASFSKLNCRRTCNLCDGGDETTTSQPRSSGCADLVDCLTHGANVCTAYRSWSKINCRKHCGLCTDGGGNGKNSATGSTHAVGCIDKVDCSLYGDTLCTGYAAFSKLNCRKTCKLCSEDGSKSIAGSTTGSSASTCADKDGDCTTAYAPDICTKFSAWARIHCQRHCGFCKADSGKRNAPSLTQCTNQVNCLSYGKNVCTAYGDWSKINCQKHCGLCSDGDGNTSADKANIIHAGVTDCKDRLKCDEFDQSACTSYSKWAHTNCRKYCGFCSSTRRKRELEPWKYPSQSEADKRIPVPVPHSDMRIPLPEQNAAKRRIPVPVARLASPPIPMRAIKRLYLEPTNALVISASLQSSTSWTCNSLITTNSGHINTIGKLLEGSTCDIAISVRLGSSILLHFTNIMMNCDEGDALLIVDNDPNKGTPLCNQIRHHNYKTMGNTAVLKMKVAQTGHGYNMTYTAVSDGKPFPACSQQLNDESGSFTSPMYPLPYPPNQHCETHINVGPSLRIQVTFASLALDQSEGCKADYVKIIDLDGTEEGVYCGNQDDLVWESTGSRVKVIFHSDGSSTDRGFTASYTTLYL